MGRPDKYDTLSAWFRWREIVRSQYLHVMDTGGYIEREARRVSWVLRGSFNCLRRAYSTLQRALVVLLLGEDFLVKLTHGVFSALPL